MCGIVGIFNIKSQSQELRNKALRMAQKIRHRGPDWSGIYVGGSAILAHERLSIVDPESGGQPLYSPDGKQILAVNGEIYNHREIRSRYAGKYAFRTGSDCEVILALYKDKGIHFLEELNGIFAFALYDEEADDYLIARDPIGVIPLYIGRDDQGHIYVGSELKALEGFCDTYEPFLPGHYFWEREGKMHRWYQRPWMTWEGVEKLTREEGNKLTRGDDSVASCPLVNSSPRQLIKLALEAAVQRQLMSDVPYGVLLSGGLDSSVISAIAKKYARKRIETNNQSEAWWPQLHSFAVGLRGAATWPQVFWINNGGKGAGRCVPSRGAFRLYNYKDQGTQDDRVSDYAVVWTINEKGADGKITEFLNNGKMVVDTTVTAAMLDDNKTTIKKYNWPTTRKWDYVAPLLANGDKDGCYQDIVYLRLADTYLLYAEALLKNNQAGEAIKWINKVRNRSNAVSITEAELTAGGVDFILDERSRELLSEEERRHTLIRVSQEKGGDERDVNNYFKRRMRQLNEIAGREARGMNSYDTPVLFPIPQEFIDSNTGRQLENNPGYL